MFLLWLTIVLQSNVEPLESLEDIEGKYLCSFASGFGRTLLITWDFSRTSKLFVIKHEDLTAHKYFDGRIQLNPNSSINRYDEGFVILDTLHRRVTFLNRDGDFDRVSDVAKLFDGKFFQRSFPGRDGEFWLQRSSDEDVVLFKYSIDGTIAPVYEIAKGEFYPFFVCSQDKMYICTPATGQIELLDPQTKKRTIVVNPKIPIETVYKDRKVTLGRVMHLDVYGSVVRWREDASEQRYFYDIESGKRLDFLTLHGNLIYDPTERLFTLAP
jgi:hypothetical protein